MRGAPVVLVPGAWPGGLAELRDLVYGDMPTNHWPMWLRPKDLSALIAEVSARYPRAT